MIVCDREVKLLKVFVSYARRRNRSPSAAGMGISPSGRPWCTPNSEEIRAHSALRFTSVNVPGTVHERSYDAHDMQAGNPSDENPLGAWPPPYFNRHTGM